MKCNQCGAENADSYKFCGVCGRSLSKRSTANPITGLSSFLGQEAIKDKLKFQFEVARKRGTALNHLLLCGPDGEGKVFLSRSIADEMQVAIKIAEGSAIERPGDFAAILTNLRTGDILLIEHIEHLNPQCCAVLAQATKDFVLDIMIGKGVTARSIRLKMPRFTLVATAPHQAAVRESLRDSFSIILDFAPYDQTSLKTLVLQSTYNDNPALDVSAATEIAKRSNGSLRIARKLANQVKDYALVNGHDVVTEKVVLNAFGILGIDDEGVGKDKTGVTFELKCMELLRRRGFEVQTTSRTSDGGIDLLAWSNDPFLGGKYIIQCKDWTNPVGAPVVRDLYGVTHSEDANRGILITSSSFTQEALDFAAGKRLELIDGRKLDYLISKANAP